MNPSDGVCSICAHIPECVAENFLETGHSFIPEVLQPLRGWEGIVLSCGNQVFRLVCPECGAFYLGEIDVEPFVWDFSVTRVAEPETPLVPSIERGV